jgi:hypothetical protein
MELNRQVLEPAATHYRNEDQEESHFEPRQHSVNTNVHSYALQHGAYGYFVVYRRQVRDTKY